MWLSTTISPPFMRSAITRSPSSIFVEATHSFLVCERFMAARLVLLGLWFLPWLMLGQAGDAQGEKAPVPHGLYRPIALALIGEGKRLVVANRDGGSLVLLDTDQRKILAETRVGKKLSDVAVTADGKRVYVTDEDTGELIVTAIVGDKFEVLRRQPVGTSPVSVRLGDQGGVVTVALLWPRRVLILREGLAPQPRPVSPEGREEKIDLPFAPRLQVPVPGTTKLIVADAFAGKLAVVDLERRKLDSVRNLPVHNVRGLALDAKQKSLLISHQMINAFGRTTKGEIQTSNLVTNHVRRLSLAALLDPRGDITREERLYQLGGIDEGAGDPAELHELGDGRLLVALAGVHEFAVGRPEEVLWTRLPVGRRPIAFAVDAARQRAYVANMFSDSISIVDLQAVRLAGGIPLAAATPKLTSLARGEMLFFDASLSFESWFSCHSCHSDGHSNGRLNDNLSDGSFGTPKRVLSLLGAKDTGP